MRRSSPRTTSTTDTAQASLCGQRSIQDVRTLLHAVFALQHGVAACHEAGGAAARRAEVAAHRRGAATTASLAALLWLLQQCQGGAHDSSAFRRPLPQQVRSAGLPSHRGHVLPWLCCGAGGQDRSRQAPHAQPRLAGSVLLRARADHIVRHVLTTTDSGIAMWTQNIDPNPKSPLQATYNRIVRTLEPGEPGTRASTKATMQPGDCGALLVALLPQIKSPAQVIPIGVHFIGGCDSKGTETGMYYSFAMSITATLRQALRGLNVSDAEQFSLIRPLAKHLDCQCSLCRPLS